MEWLTTGQMIDKLKVGEVAESTNGLGWRVKNINNRIFFVDGEEEIKHHYGFGGMAIMNGVFKKAKWTIVPNYVSFEDAMKALKEGKTITGYGEGGTSREFSIHKSDSLVSDTLHIGITYITKGKWTIES